MTEGDQMLSDITIVRQLPIINGEVVIPDRTDGTRVPVSDALLYAPRVFLSLGASSDQSFVAVNGTVGCCDNDPGDETVQIISHLAENDNWGTDYGTGDII